MMGNSKIEKALVMSQGRESDGTRWTMHVLREPPEPALA
jgi:hypothetical protein